MIPTDVEPEDISWARVDYYCKPLGDEFWDELFEMLGEPPTLRERLEETARDLDWLIERLEKA